MSKVLHFCLLMPGLVFSLCALNVVTDSMLTKAVSASDTGESRGGHALGSPGPPLCKACWAVLDGACTPIAGLVCLAPVSIEWGGLPGVSMGKAGLAGHKMAQVTLCTPVWARPGWGGSGGV